MTRPKLCRLAFQRLSNGINLQAWPVPPHPHPFPPHPQSPLNTRQPTTTLPAFGCAVPFTVLTAPACRFLSSRTRIHAARCAPTSWIRNRRWACMRATLRAMRPWQIARGRCWSSRWAIRIMNASRKYIHWARRQWYDGTGDGLPCPVPQSRFA